MNMKKYYRVANLETNQGLWYDMDGNFTGLIHDKYNFCLNTELPMPFDPDLVGWLSATDSLDELYMWFPPEDIKKLEEYGYRVFEYIAPNVKKYKNHLVNNQKTSVLMRTMTYEEVNSEAERKV